MPLLAVLVLVVLVAGACSGGSSSGGSAGGGPASQGTNGGSSSAPAETAFDRYRLETPTPRYARALALGSVGGGKGWPIPAARPKTR